MTAHPLMVVEDKQMEALNNANAPFFETWMNVQVVDTDDGLIAVMADGAALPLYDSNQFYDLLDLLSGAAPPEKPTSPNFKLNFQYVIPSRQQIQLAIYPMLGPRTLAG